MNYNFEAIMIFANNPYYRPEQILNEIETYGSLKAANFNRQRELNKLNRLYNEHK